MLVPRFARGCSIAFSIPRDERSLLQRHIGTNGHFSSADFYGNGNLIAVGKRALLTSVDDSGLDYRCALSNDDAAYTRCAADEGISPHHAVNDGRIVESSRQPIEFWGASVAILQSRWKSRCTFFSLRNGTS